MRVSNLLFLALLMSFVSLPGAANEFVHIEGGTFESVVPEDDTDNTIAVASFLMQEKPVTNAEFMQFVLHHPNWQRGKTPRVFADDQYLSSWAGPISLGEKPNSMQPVTQVSWFAATEYCQSLNARLPTWYEWEYVAAANETQADARKLPEWRQKILAWYSQSGGNPLLQVASRPSNYFQVHDIHGLVWEWVEDFNALLVTGDNREQGGADKLLFCGAGAITMQQKEDYAVLMRVAMLSALEASYTTRNLGFRCARSEEKIHD